MYLEKSSIKLFLIPALSAAVAIILLGYSSYAWVSMNRSVRATGETVKLVAPSSLEISLTGKDDDWHETVEVNLKDKVKDVCQDYNTQKNFYLMPASSYCGFNDTIWKTSHVTGVISNASQLKSTDIEAGTEVKWNPSTSSYEGSYIDIPLWFRNSSESESNIILTNNSNINNETGINVNNTVRVGFLNDNKDKNSNGADSPLVYALKTNQTNEIIKGTDKELLTLSEANYISTSDNEKPILFSMGASNFDNKKVEYSIKKIVVRIWIEGQDNYCVASIGGKTFSVNLAFAAEGKK